MNERELVAFTAWKELYQRHEKLEQQLWGARQAANAIEKEKDAVSNDLSDAYRNLRNILEQGVTPSE